MDRALALSIVLACACAKEKTPADVANDLRRVATTAIDTGSLDEADRAYDAFRAHVERHPDLPAREWDDLARELAARHARAWDLDTIATKNARYFESFQNASGCARVSAVMKWRDPAALAPLAGKLARARDLFRRGCDHWRAADASAWLGDIDGVKADLAAAHRTTCRQATSPAPATYRSQYAVGMALARDDNALAKRLADAALVLARGYAGAAVDACRARVLLAYVAELELAFSDAREHYRQAGAQKRGDRAWTGPEGDDPCYVTAAARLESLGTARDQWALPRTTVFGTVETPPGTTVRVAFQAHPEVPRDVTPPMFGLNDPDLRHPWPGRTVFWIDAEIRDKQLLARLPPGNWLPQVEIEPAGKWQLDDSVCFRTIHVKGTPGEALPDLPALRFVER